MLRLAMACAAAWCALAGMALPSGYELAAEGELRAATPGATTWLTARRTADGRPAVLRYGSEDTAVPPVSAMPFDGRVVDDGFAADGTYRACVARPDGERLLVRRAPDGPWRHDVLGRSSVRCAFNGRGDVLVLSADPVRLARHAADGTVTTLPAPPVGTDAAASTPLLDEDGRATVHGSCSSGPCPVGRPVSDQRGTVVTLHADGKRIWVLEHRPDGSTVRDDLDLSNGVSLAPGGGLVADRMGGIWLVVIGPVGGFTVLHRDADEQRWRSGGAPAGLDGARFVDARDGVALLVGTQRDKPTAYAVSGASSAALLVAREVVNRPLALRYGFGAVGLGGGSLVSMGTGSCGRQRCSVSLSPTACDRQCPKPFVPGTGPYVPPRPPVLVPPTPRGLRATVELADLSIRALRRGRASFVARTDGPGAVTVSLHAPAGGLTRPIAFGRLVKRAAGAGRVRLRLTRDGARRLTRHQTLRVVLGASDGGEPVTRAAPVVVRLFRT